MKVIAGYRHWPGVSCPYCGDGHGAIEDTGDPETYTYRCWCGSTAKVRRDDPDLVAHLGAPEEPSEEPAEPFMDL
jgi:hypothetical protein